MIDVVELLALALVRITPSQLGLEIVSFLRQVLFAEVVGIIASTITPLENIRSSNIGVLKVVFGIVVSIGSSLWKIEWTLRVWIGHCNGSNANKE